MGASIMLNAWNVLVSQSNYPDLYQIYDKDSMLAKNLYNAAMFRIRQTFTGWDKTSRTDHENEVFEEIRITKQTYPGLKIKRVLSQWIGGYCGRPCIGTDRLLCHICMASALTVKPDRSNRNRRDTPSIAIAMGGELHHIVPASKPDTKKRKKDTALPPGCVPYRRISIASVKASITSRS